MVATEEGRPAAVLSVRGEAILEVAPEIAQVSIAVMARDPRRERALELLARRNEECLALVRGFGDAVERVETSGVAVHPEIKYGARREQVRSYHGTVRLDVSVVGFAVLGELVARVSDGEMTTVAGPWWRLRPDSEVHRRVRQEAARDAIARAREYAQAVGTRLTGLLELADEGLAAQAGAPKHDARMYTMAARGAPEPPPIDLEPQLQVVQARVEARFTMSQPEGL